MKSMTGYGRAQELVDQYEVTVEIRSINHRYFEFYSRVPRVYGFLEEKLKTHVHGVVARGKVDLFLEITPLDSSDIKVQINHALARSYLDELRTLGQELGLSDDISLSRLASFHDIFQVEKVSPEETQLWEIVSPVVTSALTHLCAMREAEGTKTKLDILSRLLLIENHLSAIESLAPQTVQEYEDRLYVKLKEILETPFIDEQRVLTEVAILAERLAIDEETVRLHSHLDQFRLYLDEAGTVGRKLDFLVQELYREVNTIGSKSQSLVINHLVVEMKGEIEKIREQIQNIE